MTTLTRFLIFTLICGLPVGSQCAVEIDRIIAIVDEDVVMQSELESQIRRVREQLRQQGAALPPTRVLDRQIMDRLVLQKIQLQKASEFGVEVPEERLESAIKDIADKNKLSIDQFGEVLLPPTVILGYDNFSQLQPLLSVCQILLDEGFYFFNGLFNCFRSHFRSNQYSP